VTVNSYNFNLSGSKSGPIGWLAQVQAKSREEAVEILKMRMKRTTSYLVVDLGAISVDDAKENER
jgi:hypothetical protein